ncbi:hypothetical protein [Altericista sp. CCNU0014]|uniref:hypothetical protein n=1 Tax=Altericista sp. CCNU0014 TaxID=3082949 RepID=UPI00384BAF18
MTAKPPKKMTQREARLALIGLCISMPIVFMGCQQIFKGEPPMTAYQSLKYEQCMKEKQSLFKQSWIDADMHCAFWKTAKL